MTVQQKRGRSTPPFLAGAAAYRFLPPFFFPPLAAFFAIALYPPLRVGFVAKSHLRIAASLPPGTPTVRLYAARRLDRAIALRRVLPMIRGRATLDPKKSGVQSLGLAPPRPVGGG